MTHTSDSFDHSIYDDQFELEMDQFFFYAHNVDFIRAKIKLVIWDKWENVRYFLMSHMTCVWLQSFIKMELSDLIPKILVIQLEKWFPIFTPYFDGKWSGGY